jgi:hypothetical protein
MLRSRRYRRQQFGSTEQKPRVAVRLFIGALVLLILWYLGNRVFSLFDDSVGRGSSAVLSMEAPAPTETTTKGTQRLSPRFVEWMMGLPDGHVCDTPGITPAQARRICGNGVVPQQAAAALTWLLAQSNSTRPWDHP